MSDGPRRIRRRRTKGWKMPDGAIYVGRRTMWGNPFSHPCPEIAVRMFRVWLCGTMRSDVLLECKQVIPGRLDGYRRDMLREVPMLRGKTLVCWCGPNHACHADVLLELANA